MPFWFKLAETRWEGKLLFFALVAEAESEKEAIQKINDKVDKIPEEYLSPDNFTNSPRGPYANRHTALAFAKNECDGIRRAEDAELRKQRDAAAQAAREKANSEMAQIKIAS